MIPSEMKQYEIQLDRQKLEERKNKEQRLKIKLESMTPMIRYRLPPCINKGNFKLASGRDSKEE